MIWKDILITEEATWKLLGSQSFYGFFQQLLTPHNQRLFILHGSKQPFWDMTRTESYRSHNRQVLSHQTIYKIIDICGQVKASTRQRKGSKWRSCIMQVFFHCSSPPTIIILLGTYYILCGLVRFVIIFSSISIW